MDSTEILWPQDWDGPIPQLTGRHPDCRAVFRNQHPETGQPMVCVSRLMGCTCPTCAPHDQTDVPESLDRYLDVEYRSLCDSHATDAPGR